MRAINNAQNKKKAKSNPAFQYGKNAAANHAAHARSNRRNARQLPTRNMNRGR